MWERAPRRGLEPPLVVGRQGRDQSTCLRGGFTPRGRRRDAVGEGALTGCVEPGTHCRGIWTMGSREPWKGFEQGRGIWNKLTLLLD